MIKKIILAILSFIFGVMVTSVLTLMFLPVRGRTIVSPSNYGEIEAITQVYELLTSRHYFYEGDSEALINGAIEGMIRALDDPYSSHFTIPDFEQSMGHLDESFSGIGSEVMSVNGYSIIVAPMPNSPSEEAGILANDVIIEVDGRNVVGEPLQYVISLIRGPVGTEVTLGIQREGQPELIQFEITRAEILQESVRADLILTEGTAIGYLQVTTFGESTYRDFVKAIEELEDQGMEALIIDLRNNSGGYLGAVVRMVDYLLPEGKNITTITSRDGGRTDRRTTGQSPGKTYPIVTLINGGSASASEIFAAAMKEAGGQEVIGTTSYGKGTVQESINIDGNSILQLTIQAWLTSDGNWINGVGVQPTIEVEAPDFYSFFQVFLEADTILEYDMVHNAVANAQNILKALGYDVRRTDGFFDQSTLAAVEAFQEDQDLEVTGIIESRTARALTMALREKVRNRDYDTQLQEAIRLLK